MSTDKNGAQANGSSSSNLKSISADGRYVAFVSQATDLVPGDTNDSDDIFVKDTLTGVVTRASTDNFGREVTGYSEHPSISADGRYVAFDSFDRRLASNDIFYLSDVYIKDTQTGEVVKVSTDTMGHETIGSSLYPSISADGQLVSFNSSASSLVENDTNNCSDVFLGCRECIQGRNEFFYFPWYDNVYGKTWVLMAQPGNGEASDFEVALGNQKLSGNDPVSVTPGNSSAGFYENIIGGPITVTSSKEKTLVSERSLFGNSFEEVWATPYDELDSHYWWPMYDNTTPGMTNWILVSNPPENTEDIQAKITLHYDGTAYSDHVEYSQRLAPGESWTPNFPGFTTGPVEVQAWKYTGSQYNSNDARKVIASQRVLYNGSFNELPGIPASRLSSDYIWTWYDNVGGSNWICIANPNNADVYFGAFVGNEINPVLAAVGIIPKHSTAVIQEPGMGGPVYVVGGFDENFNTSADLIATQRVIWGPSFGEIAGTTFEDINANSHWTWYDMVNPGTSNWVLMSNIVDVPIYVEVKVAGDLYRQGVIDPGLNWTPTIPDVIGGPVEVKAWLSETVEGVQQKTTPAPVFASQRVLWNGYFSEIVGKSFDDLTYETTAAPDTLNTAFRAGMTGSQRPVVPGPGDQSVTLLTPNKP